MGFSCQRVLFYCCSYFLWCSKMTSQIWLVGSPQQALMASGQISAVNELFFHTTWHQMLQGSSVPALAWDLCVSGVAWFLLPVTARWHVLVTFTGTLSQALTYTCTHRRHTLRHTHRLSELHTHIQPYYTAAHKNSYPHSDRFSCSNTGTVRLTVTDIHKFMAADSQIHIHSQLYTHTHILSFTCTL